MLKFYNGREFIHRIHTIEEIILFGAGRKLDEVETFFKGTEIPEKVITIVDNSLEKQGTKITLWEKKFEICSLYQMTKNLQTNQLILITIEDYGSLLDDLLNNPLLIETEIVCFYHIVALEKEYLSINKSFPEKFRLEKKQMIPKKIHYCWFGKKLFPDKYKKCIESWKKFCPDYEIIEWNESNYDISKNKYMYDAYKHNVWGFVPDYARLDIVYNHGGIYLDTDVELVKKIDDLLYQKGFAGFEDEKNVAFGLGFGAVKELPILKVLMEYYEEISFVKENGELNLIPSPAYITFVLSQHGLIGNGEYQRIEDMTVYPAKVLSGKCMYTMRTVIKPWTYAIHHYDGSWATEKARRINARMEHDMRMYN